MAIQATMPVKASFGFMDDMDIDDVSYLSFKVWAAGGL
jgi:hypothetical protein